MSALKIALAQHRTFTDERLAPIISTLVCIAFPLFPVRPFDHQIQFAARKTNRVKTEHGEHCTLCRQTAGDDSSRDSRPVFATLKCRRADTRIDRWRDGGNATTAVAIQILRRAPPRKKEE
jgi:hypothetical protein